MKAKDFIKNKKIDESFINEIQAILDFKEWCDNLGDGIYIPNNDIVMYFELLSDIKIAFDKQPLF